MNNKIEYFQINDVNNVLAIQHYITKKKGKEEKKYFYEVVNKKSINNRKRLSHKKIELTSERYNQLLNGKLISNEYLNNEAKVKINPKFMNNLINHYNLDLKLANRSYYSNKMDEELIKYENKSIQKGGNINLDIISIIIKYYIGLLDPWSELNKDKGVKFELNYLFSLIKKKNNSILENFVHHNNFRINKILIVIQVKILNELKKTIKPNNNDFKIKLSKEMYKYTKFLIYLFKYGLLKYKFTNDNYDNLKFSKKIYISTLCNTFVKPGNDNEFINEKNIKKLIYFIIEKDIKIQNYYNIDSYLFSFHLHMHCFKKLRIIYFSKEELINKYTKLFLNAKINRKILDEYQILCKDELVNNKDFIDRIKYLLDLQNEETGNIFTFKSKNKIHSKDKTALINMYQKFNLSCSVSYFKIENQDEFNYIYYVTIS